MSTEATLAVWQYSQTTGSTMLFMLALADQANDAGVTWPSRRFLAQRLRVSDPRTISRYISEAVALGELRVVPRMRDTVEGDDPKKRQMSNIYVIEIAALQAKPQVWGFNMRQPPGKTATPPLAKLPPTPPGEIATPRISQSLNLKNESQKPSGPLSENPEDSTDTRRSESADPALLPPGSLDGQEHPSDESGGTDTHDPPQTPLPGPQAASTGPSDRELIEEAARRKEEAKKRRAQGYKLRAVMDSATKKAIHEATPDAFQHVLLAAKLMGMSEEKLLEAYRKRPAFPPILNTLTKSEITSITSRAIDEATRHTEGWQQYPYAWFIQYVMEAGKQAASEQRTVWDAMKVLRDELVKSPDLKTSLDIIAQYQARGEYDGGHRTPEQFALMYASYRTDE